MTALTRLILLVILAASPPVLAHESDLGVPGADHDIYVPENLSVLEFVRFTRRDHALVLHRMTRENKTHHVGTMTRALTIQALAAGQVSPRATAKLVWNMAQLSDAVSRSAHLVGQIKEIERLQQERESALADAAAGALEMTRQERASAREDLKILRALRELALQWQANPMDGAGS